MPSKLRYGKKLKNLRHFFKKVLSILYPLFFKIYRFPKVASIEETLDILLRNHYSISRFGDGEFLYIMDKLDLPFQKYDMRLANKMKEILKSNKESVLVALPIGYQSLEELTDDGRLFWKAQVVWIYPRIKKYLNLDKQYYNAHMTRVYITIRDKDSSKRYFQKLMQLWEGREVVVIEGEKSRLGVGNNLFEKAKSLRRVLAPAHHAFDRYDDIISFIVSNIPKETLILIALGPTATAMSYDLSIESYQAIDIGNIDIEYEWFLQNAVGKIKVPYKYTSEAVGGRDVEDCLDGKYLNEIIGRFN